ncbi:hypothetical protein PspCFBP13506_14460 [Pseudomonas sp. CFBP13506]|nr:hypothetical protein PspCFBP13506_14460 [Pseudomonas sp. CFBP13506]
MIELELGVFQVLPVGQRQLSDQVFDRRSDAFFARVDRLIELLVERGVYVECDERTLPLRAEGEWP